MIWRISNIWVVNGHMFFVLVESSKKVCTRAKAAKRFSGINCDWADTSKCQKFVHRWRKYFFFWTNETELKIADKTVDTSQNGSADQNRSGPSFWVERLWKEVAIDIL